MITGLEPRATQSSRQPGTGPRGSRKSEQGTTISGAEGLSAGQTERPLKHLAVLTLALALTGCAPAEVPVVITVVDASSGEPTPSRLEVMDDEGRIYIASNAIPVTLECVLSPLPEWLAPLQTNPGIFNPYTGTTQFYADGAAKLSLPPGSYRLRAAKGPEWRRREQDFEVRDGEAQEITIELERWADPASEGWYGVDDHLHITRMQPEDNHRIARWLRAEGLHIGNLLEMGTAAQISVTPQYAYGDAGAYRDGPLLLLTGEEHPRTNVLGHTISLGTEERVDQRAEYIIYESTFSEAARLGGVSGFAHFGALQGQDGLAIAAPTGLVYFVEVLQFEVPFYDVWYQLLNLGFRIAPSAGTDFPCGAPNLPGRERFYVQIPGEVNRQSFVAAVKAGRTFVSNGPLLELTVSGAGPGGDVYLDSAGIVSVHGRVRFDPDQDRIDAVELVVNGEVMQVDSAVAGPGLIELQLELPVNRAAWVALRTMGAKPADDGPIPPSILEFGAKTVDAYVAIAGLPTELTDVRDSVPQRRSIAHTGAVYVSVENVPKGVADNSLPGAWIALLEDFESRLSDDRITEIATPAWIPYVDGVTEQHLRKHRVALLEAIARAKSYYQQLVRGGE